MKIGILVLHNQDVDALIKWLKGQGISCMNLKGLRDGQIVPGIRVGTFDRGKGLEFRAVLIPRLGKSRFPLNREKPTQAQTAMKVMESTPGSTEEHEQEREEYERNLNRLYVAMTRARDRLYLIADEEPCEEIGQRAHPYLATYRSGTA